MWANRMGKAAQRIFPMYASVSCKYHILLFSPSTCALLAIFNGLGAYEMNLVARSLVPLLYRRSSVGHQFISTYKHGNSAPYLSLPLFAQNLGLTAQTL